MNQGGLNPDAYPEFGDANFSINCRFSIVLL